MTDFHAEVRQHDGMTIIDLVGTIDRDAQHELDAAYGRCAELAADEVDLSFGAVDYINSSGIALLVALLARARRDGRPVRAWGLTEHYREIFELTRLADFLEVVADEPMPGPLSATATTDEG